MEQWKEVDGTFGKIHISSYGRVNGITKILKPQIDNKGYLRVRVTINGIKRSYKVHRLVAIAFIPNPDCKPQVNHKDTNKSNNRVDNLEWATNKENCHHARLNGLWTNFKNAAAINKEASKKPIRATSADGKSSITFNSIREAESYFGTRHITAVLKGKRKHAKGYSFSYLEREVI